MRPQHNLEDIHDTDSVETHSLWPRLTYMTTYCSFYLIFFFVCFETLRLTVSEQLLQYLVVIFIYRDGCKCNMIGISVIDFTKIHLFVWLDRQITYRMCYYIISL